MDYTANDAPLATNRSSIRDAELTADMARHLDGFPLDIQGAAQAFQAHHRDRTHRFQCLAYDPKAITWRVWQPDTGWETQRTVIDEMTTIISDLCAHEAYRSTKDSEKVEKEYRKLRRAQLSIADRAINLASANMSVEQWDGEGTLLGLPNASAVQVTTKKNASQHVTSIKQEPTNYITKKLACVPGEPTELWQDFLQELTGGDKALEDALQIWTASALLPWNIHHKTHILFGDGSTGKSTYAKTIAAARGDYAGSARASVFTSEREQHPAELLPFTEKRLVVLPELSQGALRSDLLKTLTGGDSISVRGMRENPRTVTPKATLMFTCNELPSINLVDNAIKRRLLIWPFDTQPAKVDVLLGSKLKLPKHLSGVVHWLLEGLKKYLKILANEQKMPMPDVVTAATETYFKDADIMGQWAEGCIQDGAETQSTILYNSFANWCGQQKWKPQTQQSFNLWMGRRYARTRQNKGSFYPVSLVN